MSLRPGIPESGGFADRFKEFERRLAALERAARLTQASIGSGGLSVVDGGNIEIVGGQLVAGPTTVDADGVQVGDDVVIDESGLTVDGGLVQAVWADVASVLTQNVTVDPGQEEIQTVTIDPPDWVESVYVVSTVNAQCTAGADLHLLTRTIIDRGGAQENVGGSRTQFIPNTRLGAVSDTHTHNFALSPAGRSFVVSQDGAVSTGSNVVNAFRLNVLVLGFRSTFT